MNKLIVSTFVVIVCGVLFGTIFLLTKPGATPAPILPLSRELKVSRFASAEDFRSYLERSNSALPSGLAFGRSINAFQGQLQEESIGGTVGLGQTDLKTPSVPDRVSGTNVQVAGIDEPDIVKTDGTSLYISSETTYFARSPLALEPESKAIIPPYTPEITKVVAAFPVDALNKVATIDKVGNLLLEKNMLLVFSGSAIYGFDVSNPASPKQKWSADVGDNQIITSRLRQGKVYIVTSSLIQPDRPCPIIPLTVEAKPISIPCIEVYHPLSPTAVDVTYTAMVLHPADGTIDKRVSFVGSSQSSVVYMSDQALYATYATYADMITYQYNFLNKAAPDLVPLSVREKINKLQRYDISTDAKLAELEIILGQFQNSLSRDERLRLESELENRLKDYRVRNQRSFETTGIIKIGLQDFSVNATGEVPGHPLNQFSLDEYENTLRIATTVGDSFLFGSREGSVNDVYNLDQNLKVKGSVRDLGKGERIYSVRFIRDKGYVVTFRQIDPFYVLDLANPSNPRQVGELKIPGFSSYLDPLDKNLILGVGQEQSKVKLSLFDVSNPTQPREVSKYSLDEFWTEVQNNHHAFLHDSKFKVFFLPSSKGGYVLSYENNVLTLKKAVAGFQFKRAVYINDLLYVIGSDKLVVLQETDWQQVKELGL